MNLNRLGREDYVVRVTLDPDASGVWAATFDGGATWIDGVDRGGGFSAWLIAGAENDDPDSLAVWRFPDTLLWVRPKLRLVIGGEDVVVDGPIIETSEAVG